MARACCPVWPHQRPSSPRGPLTGHLVERWSWLQLLPQPLTGYVILGTFRNLSFSLSLCNRARTSLLLAAVTKHHRPGGLKRQAFISSDFWRLLAVWYLLRLLPLACRQPPSRRVLAWSPSVSLCVLMSSSYLPKPPVMLDQGLVI